MNELFEYGANIAAMVFSFIAMITLFRVSAKMGGAIGKMIKIVTGGIFLSVFCHAAFELSAVAGMINEEVLFPVMGSLLTLGSAAFVWGSWGALKSLDD